MNYGFSPTLQRIVPGTRLAGKGMGWVNRTDSPGVAARLGPPGCIWSIPVKLPALSDCYQLAMTTAVPGAVKSRNLWYESSGSTFCHRNRNNTSF